MESIYSILLSGMVATIVTIVVNAYNEKKKMEYEYKMKVFQTMIAYRGELASVLQSSGEFRPALNQVFVAFNKEKKVIDAFERFRKDKSNDNLLSLFKAMSEDLKIEYSFANDDLFMNPLV